LKDKHYFLLVEEAYGYVLRTTSNAERAVKWYLESVELQTRWFNPAIYVSNARRSRRKSECNIPRDAIPVLSSYSYLRQNVSILRDEYLKRFPENEALKKAAGKSW